MVDQANLSLNWVHNLLDKKITKLVSNLDKFNFLIRFALIEFWRAAEIKLRFFYRIRDKVAKFETIKSHLKNSAYTEGGSRSRLRSSESDRVLRGSKSVDFWVGKIDSKDKLLSQKFGLRISEQSSDCQKIKIQKSNLKVSIWNSRL